MLEQLRPSPLPEKPKFRIPARAGMFVFIFIAVVMMGLRVQDVTSELVKGYPVQAVTPAQAEPAPKEVEKPAAMKPEPAPSMAKDAKKDDMTPVPMKAGEAAKDDKPDVITTDPVIPEDQENFSEAEVNILKRLSERRQELDKRARDLDQRDALLKITEQRIDKKLGDLKTMEEQVRQMVTTASAEQKAKTDSMVKIYEIMKPKDAAHIFDALDLPILLSVISNMKESRVAPILAAMDAQKAKQVTSALMEKKTLPTPP